MSQRIRVPWFELADGSGASESTRTTVPAFASYRASRVDTYYEIIVFSSPSRREMLLVLCAGISVVIIVDGGRTNYLVDIFSKK